MSIRRKTHLEPKILLQMIKMKNTETKAIIKNSKMMRIYLDKPMLLIKCSLKKMRDKREKSSKSSLSCKLDSRSLIDSIRKDSENLMKRKLGGRRSKESVKERLLKKREKRSRLRRRKQRLWKLRRRKQNRLQTPRHPLKVQILQLRTQCLQECKTC